MGEFNGGSTLEVRGEGSVNDLCITEGQQLDLIFLNES